MAAYMGKDGFVSLLGDTEAGAFIDSWSLTAGIGTAEVTAFGDNSKAFIHTIREYTASISGTYDRTDTHQDPFMDNFDTTSQAAVSFRFYPGGSTGGSTEYWSGTALPTGLTINSAIADKVSWSGELQGTSDLSYV